MKYDAYTINAINEIIDNLLRNCQELKSTFANDEALHARFSGAIIAIEELKKRITEQLKQQQAELKRKNITKE